jgi:predicted permease
MKLDAANRYIIHFNAVAAGYHGDALLPVYRTIIDQFHTIPGVLKVGISTYTPMEDADDGDDVQVEGRTTVAPASNIIASEEYFDSVGTRLLQGRGITAQDTAKSPRVVVVNEDFVKAFFRPGEDPIGHRMGLAGDTTDGNYQIVGVVTGTSYTDVRRNGHHPMIFIPLSQGGQVDYVSSIVIQTTHPMNDMEELSRRTMTNINPNLAIQKFETFDAQIAGRFTHERMLAMLMTLFGGLALLLATVGLYGVTSYTVVRRTSEIGIRMALGAERSGVVVMVMRSALLQTLLGLAIGVPVAFYGVTLVKSQLYELTTVSGVALAIAVGTLLMAACVAGWIPARRAASVDPARALRME